MIGLTLSFAVFVATPLQLDQRVLAQLNVE
jgi:hypothetical protein